MCSVNETWEVRLMFDELLALDGKCSKSLQELIDTTKAECGVILEYGLDSITSQLISDAVKSGELHWQHINIKRCDFCNKKTRYVPYARTGIFHKKGDPNLNKPIPYDGIEIVEGRGTCMRSGIAFSGMCAECWNNVYLPKIAKCILDADLPVEIGKNQIAETRYWKDEQCKCFQCGELFWESELGEHRVTLVGGYCDEHYKCVCPHCGAIAVHDQYERTGKWRMVKKENTA